MPPRTVLPILLVCLVPLAPPAAFLAAESLRVDAGELTLEVHGDPGAFDLSTAVRPVGASLDELVLILSAPEPSAPQPISIRWSIPSHDIAGHWSTRALLDKSIHPDWSPSRVTSRFARDAPLIALFGHDDGNRLTFAVSDALDTVSLSTAIREEDGRIYNRVDLFTTRHPALTEYQIVLRLDRRSDPLPPRCGRGRTVVGTPARVRARAGAGDRPTTDVLDLVQLSPESRSGGDAAPTWRSPSSSGSKP